MNSLITLDTSKLDLSNLTLNDLNDSGLNLKIGTGNLQSIKGKAITLQDYLLESNTDIFMVMETWLKDNDNEKFGYWDHVSTKVHLSACGIK